MHNKVHRAVWRSCQCQIGSDRGWAGWGCNAQICPVQMLELVMPREPWMERGEPIPATVFVHGGLRTAELGTLPWSRSPTASGLQPGLHLASQKPSQRNSDPSAPTARYRSGCSWRLQLKQSFFQEQCPGQGLSDPEDLMFSRKKVKQQPTTFFTSKPGLSSTYRGSNKKILWSDMVSHSPEAVQ